MATITGILWDGLTAADVCKASGKCADGAYVCRTLALALVLESRRRSDTVALNGMGCQTSSDGVHRYNAWGLSA